MFPNSQFPADFVTFTKEILNGKLYFLYSAIGWFVFGKKIFFKHVDNIKNSEKY